MSEPPESARSAEIVRPKITVAEAALIARESWGLTGDPADVVELGSNQDRNFLIGASVPSASVPGASVPSASVPGAAGNRVVLKVLQAAWGRATVEAQHEALVTVAAAGIVAPTPVGDIRTVPVGDQQLLAHVLTFVEGASLIERGELDTDSCRLLGDLAGRIVAALASFAHPGAVRRSQWDLRLATEIIDEFDPALAPRVADAVARLAGVSAELPTQVIHGDVTGDNVVLAAGGEAAVIDFGDLAVSWRCAELAVTVAGVLGRTAGDVDAVLAVVQSFTDRVRLTDAELTAIWPLVVLRGGVLVATATALATLDPHNPYAQARDKAEAALFDTALRLDADEMTWLIRAAGQRLVDLAMTRIFPAVTAIPLDVTSSRWDDGAWLWPVEARLPPGEPELRPREAGLLPVEREPGSVEARLPPGERELRPGEASPPPDEPELRPGEASLLRAGGPDDDRSYATRYGEYRLDRARPRTAPGTAKVFALGVDVRLPVGTRLADLPPGVIVEGIDDDAVTIEPWVHVQACTLPGVPPRFVTATAEHLWRRICPDPSPLFGIDLAAPVPASPALLARREAHFAAVQEHYYRAPPQIERGWREFLIDTRANVYVDAVNNVATTGHSHPHLTRAATRQWSLLNTNSRFHYEASVELAERLAGLAPDGLDQVFLVNSGSEAADLALRLAMVATGRPRMLAAREAYHGWTIGTDAVTTSLADNPRAMDGRPDWVELIDAPNPVRGTHRGPGAGPAYLADLDRQLSHLDTSQLAGVILEPVFGNGGGVLLPHGYLAGVFDRVRVLGGLCISDEVQVGYGRLGHHFWGFEQQDAEPDIITIAKGMGNGQPLGAVITSRAIAEAFASVGSFFSSAGGSPVSAAAGLAVLDVMKAERLQENARDVGDHFKAGLEQLAATHEAIGAVHGLGLYLGVELVTDRASFTPATDLARTVCDALLREGCIVQPTGDSLNVLKIKPPLVIDTASADFVLAALARTLTRLGG